MYRLSEALYIYDLSIEFGNLSILFASKKTLILYLHCEKEIRISSIYSLKSFLRYLPVSRETRGIIFYVESCTFGAK